MSQRGRAGGRGRGRGRKRSSSHGERECEDVSGETGGSVSTRDVAQAGSSRARRAFAELDKSTVDRKVAELVRYLLCAQRRKAPVRKSELLDKALGSELSSCFSCFIPLVKERLGEVFGITLQEVAPTTKHKSAKQQTSVRYYILTNQIAAQAREALLPCSGKERDEQGLLFFILALIMLKDGSIQEEHLFNILKHVGISASSYHARFGDVENLIRKEFVEAKFLEREKTLIADQHRFSYVFGPRAQAVVDKKQLLAMVAELHGDGISRWEKQFGHMIPQQN